MINSDKIWGNYNRVEEASMMVFKKKSRYIENYNMKTELIKILQRFFGNTNILNYYGLESQYKLLKNYVIQTNVIGLILFGTDINKINLTIIQYYDKNENKIVLTANNICQTLINNYIGLENVDNLCRKTPNFSTYYNILI